MEIEDCNAARHARIHSVSIDDNGMGHIEVTRGLGYEPRKTPLEEFLDDMQARIDRMRGEA